MRAEVSEKREMMSSVLLDPEMFDLLDKFKVECNLQGMSKSSTTSYVSSMRIFMFFLMSKRKTVFEVDKDVLKSYIDYLINQRKIAYRTLSYNFSALAAFYEWLLFENKIKENPVQAVRKRYL
ncbi:MAG TPA: hypothetical protein HA343_04670, partial [Methanomassiliicoccales archaeon]|nr:hypothetical protein [Methanomassiliicoccales archaeon]